LRALENLRPAHHQTRRKAAVLAETLGKFPSSVKSEEAEIVNGAPSQISSNATAASEQPPTAD